MIKVTAIAPYNEFEELLKETFEKHTREMMLTGEDQNEYELETIVAPGIVTDTKSYDIDADVILARGGTALSIKKGFSTIPVVEIPMIGYDLIRALLQAKSHLKCKKAAIIGTVNMIMGAECLPKILRMEVETFLIANNNDIERVVSQVLKKDFHAIIGGGRTVEYAKELGHNAIMIKTGREAMWHAIGEAKRVAQISREEQEKVLQYKTILDYAYEGIIALDKKDVISVFNTSSEKTLGINAHRAIARKYDDVLPKSAFTELINKKEEFFDEFVKYNDLQLAVNKVPIILRDENIGTVLTFQNVQNIQEMEGKIRKKIFNRGHVAKHNFEDIIGNSRKINDVKYIAKRFSKVDSNILIEGETGTGKELFAQSIHNYSSRSSGPFVAVNCAALPESLLESELFGYAEGAFTGAAKGGKLGLFELAHKGTIFLDEISEISPKLQGRLLRVIQEKEIMRLGHDRIIPVDIRVISATNKDLHTMVKLGEFREDLYYRLDILKVKLPPLRERKEDIIEILEHFLHTYSLQNKMGKITLSNKARDILTCYGWPGNIRELKNVCERLVVLNLGHEVSENDVRLVLPNRNDSEGISRFGEEKDIGLKYAEQVKELEREKIKEVLEEVGHNKVKAAEVLCVSRTTLWRRMKELGITS